MSGMPSRDWSAAVDSLIGGQVAATITPKFSAVLQVIAQQNYNNTFWPHIEWADLKYQVTPELSVRAGRIVIPSFLVSDSRQVGYSNPWVRPPLDLYSLIPVTENDGVDASYRLHTGRVLQTLVAEYGDARPNTPTVGTAQSRRHWLIADPLEYGPTTLHLAYQESHISIAYLSNLIDAFQQFGAQGVAIESRYDPDDKLLSFLSLGAMYDPGQWFATAEWGTVDFHSVLGKKTAWYISSGYRFSRITPFVTFAQARADNLSDPGLTLSALSPSFQPTAAGLNLALNSLLRAKPVQKTISFGVRWDLVKNADLKLQFDRMLIGAGSTGVLRNVQPGFRLGSDVSVFTATVDFVF